LIVEGKEEGEKEFSEGASGVCFGEYLKNIKKGLH
jgi:hypothetical protein